MIYALFRLRDILGVLAHVAATLSAGAIIFACVAITWAVAGRGIVGMNTIWELEASVYLLIYAAFLSAAYTHRDGGQIAVEYLREALSGRARRAHRMLLDLIALGLFALIFVSGLEMFLKAWDSGWQSETLWGPKLWIPYLAVPVGAGLISASLAVDVMLRLLGQDLPQDQTQAEGH